jgi:hypothetical protein
VINTSGTMVDTKLPKSLVLGMFTWIPTDVHAASLSENWNHNEVDVEISQWGDTKHRYAQFLIPPSGGPGSVTRHHFYMGLANGSYDQTRLMCTALIGNPP